MSSIRVLLVDDHPVFLEGLYTILRLRDPEIEVVGTATDGNEALRLERELSPDVVLLDIKMPILDGVTVARELCLRRPDIKIIMLTTFDDRRLITDALRAGAKGYLVKDAHAAEIIEAIKHVSRNNVLISGNLALKLSESGGPAPSRQGDAGEESSMDALAELSDREREVLQCIAQGLNNGEIAAKLTLSEKTVRNYISRIYEILNIHTRTKAALWALQNMP
jgi:two-component system, NarL family, response regulator LiaR